MVESYAALLRKCTESGALEEGKKVHSQLAICGLDKTSTFLGNLLIQMYGGCRCMEKAQLVFHKMGRRNKFTWNILLTAYALERDFFRAKQVFDRMPCADIIAWTAMLVTSQSQGALLCRRLFDSIPEKCIISWNVMLSAYAQYGDIPAAIDVFSRLPQRRIHSWNIMIKMFGDAGSVEKAKSVLDDMPERDIITWNMMLTAFGQNGHPLQAKQVFDKMPSADVVTWTSMLQTSTRLEDLKMCFDSMPQRCVVSWNVSLSAFAQLGDLNSVTGFFQKMPERLMSSWNILLKALGDGGQVDQAKNTLMNMPERDIVSWNTFLAACCQHHPDSAHRTFRTMPQHDVISCTSAIASSFHTGDTTGAEAVFNSMRERDTHTCSTMLLGYLHSGDVPRAVSVFQQMPYKDLFAWSVIIAAHAQEGQVNAAVKTFSRMDLEGVQPCEVTYTRILDACADSASLALGRLVHNTMVEKGTLVECETIVGTSIVNMYGKCRSVEQAKAAFDRIRDRDSVAWATMVAVYTQNGEVAKAESVFREAPERNLVAWNAMLTAYVQCGMYDRCTCKALGEMDVEGVAPNESTYIVVLEACACGTRLAEGRLVHWLVSEFRVDRDLVVATGLINLYGKCGCVVEAREVFEGMCSRDVVAWTAMVAAYSKNGYGQECVELFQQFKLDGLMPNDVLFTTVLSVCSHAGLVEEAREYFVSLVGDFGMVAGMDHYVCMVDMLGRAGKVRDSQLLLNTMPYEPHAVAWTSLVHASGCQGEKEATYYAVEKAKEVEFRLEASPYFRPSLTVHPNFFSLRRGTNGAPNVSAGAFCLRGKCAGS